jgi:hypothetical protein
MFKNNIENQFSKDLLDEVKKVMQKKTDEAKNDLPWSEDPKNPTRSAGTRKDKYGNVIKNVAKHLARKAMKANEETTADKWNVVRSGKVISSHSSKNAADAKAMKHPLNRVVANEEVEHNACGTPECCGECNDVVEVAPPGAKFERMVKHIKKGYSKGGLTDQEKSIAYATAWKNKKANEEVDISEGIMHNRYERSHGKKARGTGSWAFTTKLYGSPKEHEMHFTSGEKTLKDAHAEATKKLGTKNLYVMEEVEGLDEDSRTPQEKVSHAIRDHNYDMMRTTSPADRAEKKEDHKAFLAAMKKKHPEVRISEETDQFEQDAMNLSAEEFESKWLAPQVNELDEAFDSLFEGRPKIMIQHPWDKDRKLHPVKDQALIAKLRAKGYTNLGDRPSSENPINQLRKAKLSMTGEHHVTLHTGEKHTVTGTQASRILDKHAGMKTAQEKLDYQDKLRDKDFLKKEAGQ